MNTGFNCPIFILAKKADDNTISVAEDSPYHKLKLEFECYSLGGIVMQTKEQLQIVIK